MSVIIAALRFLGPAGIAAVLAFLFYEGLPGINRLPYVDQIPFVREFGVGRVELERRKAVAGLVSRAELDALSAILDQERAKASASAAMATEERNRAAAAIRMKEEQDAEIERMIEEAKQSPGLTYPSQEDMQWRTKSR